MKNTSLIIIKELISSRPELEVCYDNIVRSVEIITDCYENGNKLLVCGNGGSAADSLHIVGELMKGFVLRRGLCEKEKERFLKFGEEGRTIADSLQGALPAISLINESSLNTAFVNDVDASLAFAQQVYGLGRSGDVLIGISTSGNAKNVYAAGIAAKARGCSFIALTGRDGGKIAEIADASIIVPEKETYKIQELHLPVYHAMCLALENEFFGE